MSRAKILAAVVIPTAAAAFLYVLHLDKKRNDQWDEYDPSQPIITDPEDSTND